MSSGIAQIEGSSGKNYIWYSEPEYAVVCWAMLALAMWVADMIYQYIVQKQPSAKANNENAIAQSSSDFGSGLAPKKGIFAALQLAPPTQCLYSLTLYVYLWGCGVCHLWRALFGGEEGQDGINVQTDISLLVVLYIAETIGAFVVKRSPMKNWRQIDFVLHHIPFAAVVGGAMLYDAHTIVRLFPFTLPLDLMTSANEATAATRALGAPRCIDIPNRFYLLALMVCLVIAEVYEACHVLISPGHPAAIYLISLLTLAAPVYHATMVIPYCWKIVKRWSRARINGTPYPPRQ